MHLVNQLLLVALLVLAPVAGVAQPALIRKNRDFARIPVYLSSGILVLVLGASSAGVGGAVAGPAALGFAPLALSEFAIWTAALAAALLGFMALSTRIARAVGLRDSPVLAGLLPGTRRERACFAGLSLLAGSGEEIAYRGYAISALGAMSVGPWTAAAITSTAFGLLHSYQGVRGVATAGVAGFAFAASFVATRSIWPAIAAHTMIDLIVGLALGEKLLAHEGGGTEPCA